MSAPTARAPTRSGLAGWRRLALAIGPGVVVMLADTDAGSVITAAQSGAQWGYRLLLPQFLVIPILFAMQELTIRLGLGTGLGFAELIRKRFGRFWAWLALATLVVSCFGALVTQLSALGGLSESFGVSGPLVVCATVAFLISVATLGAYASVERIAITLGMFELAFLVVAWRAGPDPRQMMSQMREAPIANTGYLYLLAANIGTTFMPWAAFYQQSAMVDKRLHPSQLAGARWETLGGAILCQIITAAILIAGAATVGHGAGGASFSTIGEMAATFAQALGPRVGRIVFALGLSGSALVAAMVVSLTVAWAAGEVAGARRSLRYHPREAPGFYAAFVAVVVAGGAFVALGADPVRLSIAVGVVNALLLPIVLALLYGLARTELSGALAFRGRYALALGAVFAATAAVALYSGIAGALG